MEYKTKGVNTNHVGKFGGGGYSKDLITTKSKSVFMGLRSNLSKTVSTWFVDDPKGELQPHYTFADVTLL